MAVWALALPIFLISTNVRWVTLDLATYTTGFARYRASERTGITPAELERIGREFIEFFKGNRTEMQVEAQTPSGTRQLFNTREVQHMDDVRKLMMMFFRVQPLAGVILIGTIALAVLLFRREAISVVQAMIYAGVAFTLFLALIVGGLSMLDFESLFIQFHMLSFSNDLWQLDPRTDYLLILYPEPFWLDTTLRIAWMTLIELLALAGAAWLLPHWKMR
ncbi:MAG TPA: TIGR01906 family membrane protein [Chloroflexota bacterium]|nr:TIGR01906 family membrane protein [Chloroflexota bacterium]